MGHKVNPDIFRLGVSKSWIFQLRTNKNFIKNLFLFKFLRNLFMNYTTPFFDFNNRRNTKINDKLVLRGEDQIVSSPFVKNNLLFSHVYFGLIKDRLFIESFFIDVNFKQPRKKNEKAKRGSLMDIADYKPWNSLYYKTTVLNRLNRKKFRAKYRNKIKKIFSSRPFKFYAKKSANYKIKSVKQLSKDFYFFLRNFNPKYNKILNKYLNTNYRFFVKRIAKKSKKRRRRFFLIRVFKIRKKPKRKLSALFQFFQKEFFRKKILKDRYKNFRKNYLKFRQLYFIKNIFSRKNRRIIQRKGLRKLKNPRKLNPIIKYKYKHRRNTQGYRLITLPKLMRIISKSYYSAFEFFSLKKGFPKNPLYIYDLNLSNEKAFVFYQNYKNLSLLKYFIRTLKFMKYFSIKKKIFFSQNLISLLMNFFGLVNSTVLTKKIFLLFQNIMFYTLSFSFFNFLNFKKTFFSRFVFFKGVSKTIYRSIVELTKNNRLNFSVVGQNKFRFNSSLVLNYILIKLGQYFSIHEIVNPLSFYIKSLTSISGYKILIRGRLTRKERAAVMIRSGKRMPLSTIKANIDYSAGFKIMKFGLVGIKVYLLLNKSDLLNLYKFQYNYS